MRGVQGEVGVNNWASLFGVAAKRCSATALEHQLIETSAGKVAWLTSLEIKALVNDFLRNS